LTGRSFRPFTLPPVVSSDGLERLNQATAQLPTYEAIMCHQKATKKKEGLDICCPTP